MKKAFFGIPAYKGIRCVPFYEALESTINLVQSHGWTTVLSVLQGSCYVQTARNELVKAFLDTDCDTLFFLDDDISWNPEDALKLLNMDDDIVAGIYPYKTEEEGYPVVIHTDGEGRPTVREDGCLYGAFIPFGFVAIKRHVIQKLWDGYPSLTYWKPEGFNLIEFRDLFPQGVKNGRWVGEDFAFCDLWHGLEGEITVVPDIDFTHHGEQQDFHGNYHRFLLGCPGGSEWDGKNSIYNGNVVDGWLTQKEQQFLFDVSNNYESVLEVGSYLGKSSLVLLQGKAKKVVCVDNWKPYHHLENDTEELAEGRYQEFLENVKDYRGNGRLKIVRADSTEAAKQFEDDSIDVVFIDADHTEEGVRADIQAWLPKAKKMICGHDYAYYWPGVKAAVNEAFGDRFKLADTIWYVEVGQ